MKLPSVSPSATRQLSVSFVWPLFVALCGLAASVVNAAPPPAGVAPVVQPSGGFGIDGDLFANAPTAGVGDWLASTNSPGTGGAVLSQAGVPLNPLTTFHFVDPYGGNDLTFAGGQKWFDNPNTWQWTGGKASSKTDINNVLLHITTDTNGHVWAVIAADRLSTSGDSYIDFEFLQNTLTRNTNGYFVSAGPNGGRTTNDLLLSLAFTGGGSGADFFVWRWQANGSGGFTYVDATASLPAGRVFAALNGNTIAVPYGAFGQTNYAPNAFAEAAVDLTALLGNFDPCLSVGFKTIMVKTKSSQSSTASIEDFIDPIQYNLKIGPSAEAGPDQARCVEGDATAFPLNGAATPGFYPIAATTWSVVSGTATIDSSQSLATTAHVSSATATLRLTVVQANGCTETDDVVLAVAPLPVCSITGPSLVCPQSNTQFSGPAGMKSYSWSITGNGSVAGPTNQQNVTATAGTSCGENFTLTLNVTGNLCSSTCSADVMVNDTTPPTLACPADIVLECPADTGTNVTGAATAQDDCGQVTVSNSDVVTNICGGAKVIWRTWTATDSCGNSTNCVQTITVRDTTKPSITCPADVVLECPANSSTSVTGVATARDACGQVVEGFSDTITTNCSGTKVIARTWIATDECGNFASCVQTITVRDTTKPSITCPADVVLECPANTGANATGVATAQDACGQVTMSFSDSVSNACGGTKVISRTWTATDECGNSASCVQKITVRDTTAPTITCPPDLALECPANASTNATGVATAQDACGQVTVRYSDAVTTNCGGTKVIARTWLATDECGNSTNCVQTITVRDTTKPALFRPADVVLECPATDTSTNVTGTATATDNCGQVTVSYTDSVTTNCGGTKVIARTWAATDACGNSTNAVQTITVRDTTKPTITCPPNLVLECPAATTTNVTGEATAQDACGSVTMRYSDSVSNGCGGAKVISRTWTATDACGNSSSCVQTITVRDTTAPTMTCPPDATLECGASTAPSATGTATAHDACSSVTVSYSDSVSNICGGAKVIWRTWTAVDSCGNSTNGVQIITARDTTPPALTLPANRVLECPGDTRTNMTGVATAQDGCGSATISYSDVVSNGCGLTRTVLRLWTATDQCGNSTNGLQTIIVADTQKPRITCPTIAVQCVDEVPAPYASLAAFQAAGGTATDACDASLDFALMSDSGLVGRCPGKVTRVYRVTDDCGNFAECTQTITVDDTIAPILTCPASVTAECGASLDPANLGTATATDNCATNVTITHSDAAVQSTYNLKWYAADPDLGTGPYSPTYLKLAPGSLTCPDAARLTGRAVDPLRNAIAFAAPSGQLDALTSLGGAPMALGQIVPFEVVIETGGAPGPERGTIEFTSTWSTHTTSNDEFGYDKNYMVYCAFVDPADPGSIDPNNNARVESFSSVLVNPGSIDEQIQGTFRVAGLDSGDRVVVEIWVVLMSTMPDHVGGTIAANLVSAQKASVPPELITTGVQTVSIGNLSKISPLPPAQEQPPLPPLPPQPPVLPGATVSAIDRTWAATDDCGNRSTCVQRITVRDATPPALTVPADRMLECPADITTNSTGTATAWDACGSVLVYYSDVVSNSCGGTKTIWRTWTATDQSGNSTNAVQTLTVRDTTPPTLTSLTNRTVTNSMAWSFDTPVATDACGRASVRVVSTVTNATGPDSFTVTRTWEAADECGNKATCQQMITVIVPPPPPVLELLQVGPNKLMLRWPQSASGYRLEAADGCRQPNWKAMPVAPVVSNGFCCVLFTPTSNQKICRLSKVPPMLELQRIGAGALRLNWPALPTGFQLEASDSLTAPNWSPVPAVPVTTNSFYYVELTPTSKQKFYRLKKTSP